jgi:hypothetical protein
MAQAGKPEAHCPLLAALNAALKLKKESWHDGRTNEPAP